jgi:hypothetical protein
MLQIEEIRTDRSPPALGGLLKRQELASACLSHGEILRYLLNVASDQERERLESHISTCGTCHASVEGMRIGFELAFEDDPDSASC